ncbi:hypothetical protein U1701_05490 [Sphingomonas sp. PB2P19]|uniref:hypothetical protein n=1 Tax=Sphingomonas rhamnosi TaxID=3096156 RepID=UPI002FC63C67
MADRSLRDDDRADPGSHALPSGTAAPALRSRAAAVRPRQDRRGRRQGFRQDGFASLGISSDRQADETAWDIDAYLGFDAPFLGLGSELELQPFASLQYHTQKKGDDLAFGGAPMWYPGNSGHLVRLKGAWESDINFRSSVWRSDLALTPPLLDWCEEQSVPGSRPGACQAPAEQTCGRRLGGRRPVVDHLHVDDGIARATAQLAKLVATGVQLGGRAVINTYPLAA